jgi:hypothetical protein
MSTLWVWVASALAATNAALAAAVVYRNDRRRRVEAYYRTRFHA